MNHDDVVEPGDNALQALLALVAEHTDDQDKRDFLYDFILTCPPLHGWPMGSQDRLAETCNYVIGLAVAQRVIVQE